MQTLKKGRRRASWGDKWLSLLRITGEKGRGMQLACPLITEGDFEALAHEWVEQGRIGETDGKTANT